MATSWPASSKAGISPAALPAASQILTLRSLPVETITPSLAMAIAAAPPGCASQDFKSLLSFMSHILSVPSSEALTTAPESGLQAKERISFLWACKSAYILPVDDSQITRPAARSAVANNKPSGLNRTA